MKSLSHVQLFATPWTVDHQAPPSMGFSRQEYWSGVSQLIKAAALEPRKFNCRAHQPNHQVKSGTFPKGGGNLQSLACEHMYLGDCFFLEEESKALIRCYRGLGPHRGWREDLGEASQRFLCQVHFPFALKTEKDSRVRLGLSGFMCNRRKIQMWAVQFWMGPEEL